MKAEIIVYRENPVKHGYEIGRISYKVPNINRTGIAEHWCDSRICETWNEELALHIVNALQEIENKHNSK
jgi:hypothetical protein